MDDNQISDISPLAGLTLLESLDLGQNQISDLTPLVGLLELFELRLNNNQISDVDPLLSTGLGHMGLGDPDYLDLRENPLSCTSISEHIPALESRNVAVEWTDTVPCVSTTTTTAAATTTTGATTTTTGAATTTTTTATTTSMSTTTLPQSDVAGGVPFCAIKLRVGVAVEKTKLVPKDKVQKAIDKGFEQGECYNPQNGQVMCKDKPARPGKPAKRANVLVPESQVQKALDKGFYTLGECETM